MKVALTIVMVVLFSVSLAGCKPKTYPVIETNPENQAEPQRLDESNTSSQLDQQEIQQVKGLELVPAVEQAETLIDQAFSEVPPDEFHDTFSDLAL